jgi:hypothetical protein
VPTLELGTTVTPAHSTRLKRGTGTNMRTDKFLLTGGGAIRCLRCTAKAKSTGEQCGRPALKSSSTAKCGLHGGGARSGVQTPEGRQRIIKANTKHGQATQAVRQAASRMSCELAQLADVMRVLEMTDAGPSAGRKPSGYYPIKTHAEAVSFLVGLGFQPVTGSGKAG